MDSKHGFGGYRVKPHLFKIANRWKVLYAPLQQRVYVVQVYRGQLNIQAGKWIEHQNWKLCQFNANTN